MACRQIAKFVDILGLDIGLTAAVEVFVGVPCRLSLKRGLQVRRNTSRW